MLYSEIIEQLYIQEYINSNDIRFASTLIVEDLFGKPLIYRLANELYEKCIIDNQEWKFVGKTKFGIKVYEKKVSDISVSDDFFIDLPYFIIRLYLSGIEKPRTTDASLGKEMFKNGKIYKPSFIIRQDVKELKLNYESFIYSISHELQHLYRQYCVITNYFKNGTKNKGEIEKSRQYSQIYDISDTSKIEDEIKYIYYTSDDDEINANAASLESYLYSHIDIDKTNYKEHLNELPMYSFINRLKGFSDKLSVLNDEQSIFYGKIVKDIIYKNNDVSYEKAFNLMLKRVNKRLEYAYRIFYKTLGKAFSDLNRNL